MIDTLNEPIICTGNELSERLAEVRARGGRVEAMDTGVGSNAGYRLHVYFAETQPTERQHD